MLPIILNLRCEAPHLSIKTDCFSSLNQCMAEILYDALFKRGESVDPMTQLNSINFMNRMEKDHKRNIESKTAVEALIRDKRQRCNRY